MRYSFTDRLCSVSELDLIYMKYDMEWRPRAKMCAHADSRSDSSVRRLRRDAAMPIDIDMDSE